MTSCPNCLNAAGWCERHQVYKPLGWVQLCQQRGAYWRDWERGHGPAQHGPVTEQSRHEPSPPVPGPGTELKKILWWVNYIPRSGSCGCNEHADLMDQWGPANCRTHINTILDWLSESACKMYLPFCRPIVRRLVLIAIARSEKIEAEKKDRPPGTSGDQST